MKIYWSDIAEADLDDIYDFISRDVPYYAEQFIDRLIDATDKLEAHPRIGRRVPEADRCDDIRELVIQGYRIIYLVNEQNIHILTVIHGSHDLAGRENKPWDSG
jgi:addiction module RelE/StbE family toxin